MKVYVPNFRTSEVNEQELSNCYATEGEAKAALEGYRASLATTDLFRETNAQTGEVTEVRKDANGNTIPWSKEHDYFMGFDPENPDVPTD